MCFSCFDSVQQDEHLHETLKRKMSLMKQERPTKPPFWCSLTSVSTHDMLPYASVSLAKSYLKELHASHIKIDFNN